MKEHKKKERLDVLLVKRGFAEGVPLPRRTQKHRKREKRRKR